MRHNLYLVSDAIPAMQIARRQEMASAEKYQAERLRKGKADFDNAASMLGTVLVILAVGSLVLLVIAGQNGWLGR